MISRIKIRVGLCFDI